MVARCFREREIRRVVKPNRACGTGHKLRLADCVVRRKGVTRGRAFWPRGGAGETNRGDRAHELTAID